MATAIMGDTEDRLCVSSLRGGGGDECSRDKDTNVDVDDGSLFLHYLATRKRQAHKCATTIGGSGGGAAHVTTTAVKRSRCSVGSSLSATIADPVVDESLINSLGCLVAKVRRPTATTVTPSSRQQQQQQQHQQQQQGRRRLRCDDDTTPTAVVVPPYEYCSVAMLNQLRQGNNVDKVLTDKGGTIKNILQSSKSFVHYLVTYPLKNTFRGYIQVSPFLAPRHIALPFHHAVKLFSIDVERDRTRLRYRRDVCCNDDDDDDDMWPDSSCSFYFETTANFALVLKRDPCIHNGSVVAIKRVYVYERALAEIESIHISPFILKHLNADFDGDAVTVMILRGIESTIEATHCLSDPLLFVGIPRFTFCQSMIFWTFRALAFDEEFDELNAVAVAEENGDDGMKPVAAERLLRIRLNVWHCDDARRRARAVFGPWYREYVRVLARVWLLRRHRISHNNVNSATTTKDDCRESLTDWSLPIWRQRPVLDMVYMSAVRRNGARAGAAYIDRIRRFLYRRRRRRCDNSDAVTVANHGGNDELVVLTDSTNVYCLENWIMVHSGAKGTPRDLVSLQERILRNTCTDRNVDDGATVEPQTDFFRECDAEREAAYMRYLDDFVCVSKHVPKSSYFASGLKWVTQRCSVRHGDLYMFDQLLLRDIAYYVRDLK